MKTKILASTLLSIGVILAFVAVLPVELTFGTPKASPPQYRLIDMGTFGGPASYLTNPGNGLGFSVLNDAGVLVGRSDTSTFDPILGDFTGQSRARFRSMATAHFVSFLK